MRKTNPLLLYVIFTWLEDLGGEEGEEDESPRKGGAGPTAVVRRKLSFLWRPRAESTGHTRWLESPISSCGAALVHQ